LGSVTCDNRFVSGFGSEGAAFGAIDFGIGEISECVAAHWAYVMAEGAEFVVHML